MIDLAKLQAAIQATAPKALERAAMAGALEIIKNIEAGPRSGAQYRGQPRQSSALGEFPQEQSGALVDSIDARPIGVLRFGIGAFDAPDWAVFLEFAKRPWLSRTLEDPRTWQRMNEEVGR